MHPNKADVRFADNRIVYGTVYSVISAVLDGSSAALEYISPAISSTVGKNKGAVSPLPEAPEKAPALAAQPASAASAKPVPPETPAFKAAPKPAEAPSPAPAFKASPAAASNPAATPQTAKPVPRMSVEEAKKELAFEIPKLHGRDRVRALEEEKPNTFEVRSPLASSRPAPQEEQEDAFEENKKYLLERDERAKQQKIDPATLIFRGVLFETYLIFERGDEAYFIDQHAAHERLIYEKLKNKCEARTPLSQPMLMPRSISSAWTLKRSSAKCSPRWNRSVPSV